MGRPRKIIDPPAKPKAKNALLEKYADFEGIAVIERRFENPVMPGSLPILLKDEPTYVQDPQGKKRLWYVRWINGAIPGRTSLVTDALGYVPVRTDELQNPQSVTGLSKSDDGIVRRGDKGEEWLGKMPLEVYTEVKKRQRDSINPDVHRHAVSHGLGDEAEILEDPQAPLGLLRNLRRPARPQLNPEPSNAKPARLVPAKLNIHIGLQSVHVESGLREAKQQASRQAIAHGGAE